MSPQPKLSLSLPASPDASATARQVARAFEPYLEEGRAADLSLLVSEVVSNGVRHSTADGANQIGLELSVGDEVLRAEVTDRGEGFEPDVPEEPDNSTAGGWGLYLVETLADRWGVSPSGATRVWFEFDRHRTRPTRQESDRGVRLAG